jgi:hypothetical protein
MGMQRWAMQECMVVHDVACRLGLSPRNCLACFAVVWQFARRGLAIRHRLGSRLSYAWWMDASARR